MERKYRLKLTISISLIFILLCSVLFIFQIKFGSINAPRIVYAVISVNNSDNDFFVIKDARSNKKSSDGNSEEPFFANPKKVVIATPDSDYNFSDYVKSIGYDIVEDKQYGSKIVIEKDGNKEEVFISSNLYYSLWQWY